MTLSPVRVRVFLGGKEVRDREKKNCQEGEARSRIVIGQKESRSSYSLTRQSALGVVISQSMLNNGLEVPVVFFSLSSLAAFRVFASDKVGSNATSANGVARKEPIKSVQTRRAGQERDKG